MKKQLLTPVEHLFQTNYTNYVGLYELYTRDCLFYSRTNTQCIEMLTNNAYQVMKKYAECILESYNKVSVMNL